MTNISYMAPAIDNQKNIKASAYTGAVCILVFIIFFFAKWTLPIIPPPPVDDGIEVNLGNSDEGLGDLAPQVPGPPAKDDDVTYTPPATTQPIVEQEQPIAGDENETDEATVVNKTPKTIEKKISERPKTEVKPKPIMQPSTQPVSVTPTPVPPKAKAIYKGGTASGTGGNNADTYNGVRNQGIAGGKGDQGSSNGNPNSDSYKGNGGTGNSGVRIRNGLGGRRFTRLPSFEDDFNENAKVAVNIRVDQAGNVTSATINLQGTTTTNAGIRAIALRKAMQLKLNSSTEDDQSGTILFDFKLKG